MAYFEHDGVRLAYDVAGEGFPIVLHTGAAGDSQMWRKAGYVEPLSGFQVILFDHRGHGGSSTPGAPDAYSVESHVADVVALAAHLGLTRFAFWGYSLGARIGYQLAVTEPALVAALVAQGTVDGESDDPADWLEDAAVVRAQGLIAILGDEPMPDWLRASLLETDREVLAHQFECFAGWSPWPLFAEIIAPTLIVAGELEDQGCAAAAARMQAGRSVILPGLGHIGAFAESSTVLGHVLPFLRAAAR
jgi:pimeloyl-ACP methyl ester carboxylesterase